MSRTELNWTEMPVRLSCTDWTKRTSWQFSLVCFGSKMCTRPFRPRPRLCPRQDRDETLVRLETESPIRRESRPHPWKSNYCPRGSDGQYCFRRSFFLCAHDNDNAALSSMKFCRSMHSTTSKTLLNFKVIFFFFVRCPNFTIIERGKILVDNAVFRLSIARSVPEIFAIKI